MASSKTKRRPFGTIITNSERQNEQRSISATASTTSSRRPSRKRMAQSNTRKTRDICIVDTEQDAFLKHASSNTPKISNASKGSERTQTSALAPGTQANPFLGILDKAVSRDSKVEHIPLRPTADENSEKANKKRKKVGVAYLRSKKVRKMKEASYPRPTTPVHEMPSIPEGDDDTMDCESDDGSLGSFTSSPAKNIAGLKKDSLLMPQFQETQQISVVNAATNKNNHLVLRDSRLPSLISSSKFQQFKQSAFQHLFDSPAPTAGPVRPTKSEDPYAVGLINEDNKKSSPSSVWKSNNHEKFAKEENSRDKGIPAFIETPNFSNRKLQWLSINPTLIPHFQDTFKDCEFSPTSIAAYSDEHDVDVETPSNKAIMKQAKREKCDVNFQARTVESATATYSEDYVTDVETPPNQPTIKRAKCRKCDKNCQASSVESVTVSCIHSIQSSIRREDGSIVVRLEEPSVSFSEALQMVYFEVGGKLIPHPPLPPGWKIRVSESKKRPFYCHPDHGTTWHCPVVLPQYHTPAAIHRTSTTSESTGSSRYSTGSDVVLGGHAATKCEGRDEESGLSSKSRTSCYYSADVEDELLSVDEQTVSTAPSTVLASPNDSISDPDNQSAQVCLSDIKHERLYQIEAHKDGRERGATSASVNTPLSSGHIVSFAFPMRKQSLNRESPQVAGAATIRMQYRTSDELLCFTNLIDQQRRLSTEQSNKSQREITTKSISTWRANQFFGDFPTESHNHDLNSPNDGAVDPPFTLAKTESKQTNIQLNSIHQDLFQHDDGGHKIQLNGKELTASSQEVKAIHFVHPGKSMVVVKEPLKGEVHNLHQDFHGKLGEHASRFEDSLLCRHAAVAGIVQAQENLEGFPLDSGSYSPETECNLSPAMMSSPLNAPGMHSSKETKTDDSKDKGRSYNGIVQVVGSARAELSVKALVRLNKSPLRGTSRHWRALPHSYTRSPMSSLGGLGSFADTNQTSISFRIREPPHPVCALQRLDSIQITRSSKILTKGHRRGTSKSAHAIERSPADPTVQKLMF